MLTVTRVSSQALLGSLSWSERPRRPTSRPPSPPAQSWLSLQIGRLAFSNSTLLHHTWCSGFLGVILTSWIRAGTWAWGLFKLPSQSSCVILSQKCTTEVLDLASTVIQVSLKAWIFTHIETFHFWIPWRTRSGSCACTPELWLSCDAHRSQWAYPLYPLYLSV